MDSKDIFGEIDSNSYDIHEHPLSSQLMRVENPIIALDYRRPPAWWSNRDGDVPFIRSAGSPFEFRVDANALPTA
jgi:hypothetical protein